MFCAVPPNCPGSDVCVFVLVLVSGAVLSSFFAALRACPGDLASSSDSDSASSGSAILPLHRLLGSPSHYADALRRLPPLTVPALLELFVAEHKGRPAGSASSSAAAQSAFARLLAFTLQHLPVTESVAPRLLELCRELNALLVAPALSASASETKSDAKRSAKKAAKPSSSAAAGAASTALPLPLALDLYQAASRVQEECQSW